MRQSRAETANLNGSRVISAVLVQIQDRKIQELKLKVRSTICRAPTHDTTACFAAPLPMSFFFFKRK